MTWIGITCILLILLTYIEMLIFAISLMIFDEGAPVVLFVLNVIALFLLPVWWPAVAQLY